MSNVNSASIGSTPPTCTLEYYDGEATENDQTTTTSSSHSVSSQLAHLASASTLAGQAIDAFIIAAAASPNPIINLPFYRDPNGYEEVGYHWWPKNFLPSVKVADELNALLPNDIHALEADTLNNLSGPSVKRLISRVLNELRDSEIAKLSPHVLNNLNPGALAQLGEHVVNNLSSETLNQLIPQVLNDLSSTAIGALKAHVFLNLSDITSRQLEWHVFNHLEDDVIAQLDARPFNRFSETSEVHTLNLRLTVGVSAMPNSLFRTKGYEHLSLRVLNNLNATTFSALGANFVNFLTENMFNALSDEKRQLLVENVVREVEPQLKDRSQVPSELTPRILAHLPTEKLKSLLAAIKGSDQTRPQRKQG